MLAGDTFHNTFYPQDVDQNFDVTPRDALVIINALNSGGARQLVDPTAIEASATIEEGLPEGEAASAQFMYDVNNDGNLSASDALRVINFLNAEAEAEGEEQMEFRIQLLQAGTNTPLTGPILKGTDFDVQVIVQDLRGPGSSSLAGDRGVFSAYLDLLFNKSLANVEIGEMQQLSITGTPSGGNFRLTFNDGAQTLQTANINFNAASTPVQVATAIQSALVALNNVNPGEVEVVPVSNFSNTQFRVRFQGRLGDQNLAVMTDDDAAVEVTTLSEGGALTPAAFLAQFRRYQVVSGAVREFYTNQPGGADGTSPDRIDDAGGLANVFSFQGVIGEPEDQPQLLFRIRMNTLDAGVFSLAGSVADIASGNENTLFGSAGDADEPLLPEEIRIVNPGDVTIREPFSAIADSFPTQVVEDAVNVTLNVTANDTANNAQGNPSGALPAAVVIHAVNGVVLTPGNASSSVVTAGGGIVKINSGSKTLSYTAPANSGIDSFTYTLRDPATGITDTATVTVTVNSVNDPPVHSVPGAQSVAEDGTLVFSVANSNVISISDSDAGNNEVQTTLTATNGVLTLGGTTGLTFIGGADGVDDASMTIRGTISAINTALLDLQYEPNGDFNGSANLQIVTSDLGNTGGAAQTDTDNIAITVTAVNDAPVVTVPAAQNATETIDLTLPAITLTDVDVTGTNMQVTVSIGAGTLHLASTTGLTFVSGGDGTSSMSFTGTMANITAALSGIVYKTVLGDAGTQTLTVRAEDSGSFGAGGELFDQETVTINVVPLERPFAIDDAFTVAEDSGGTVLNVLTNPPTPDFVDDNNTAVLVDISVAPQHGTAVANPDGTITYTPNADFFGNDTFRYRMNQTPNAKPVGDLDEDQTATVTITVTPVADAPVADADSATTNEDTAVDVNVLDGDIDVDLAVAPASQAATAATHNVIVMSQPANGTASVNANGTIRYTPSGDFSGSDSFTYRIQGKSDGLFSNTVTVSLTVNAVNDAPLADDDSYSTDEDIALVVTAPGVLDGDTDVDNATLTVDTVTQQPTKGTIVLNSDGSFTYNPNENATGTDTFKYRVTDGSLTDEATVTITINAVNDPPVAVSDSQYTATEDTPRVVSDPALGLLANDTDVDNTAAQLSVVFGSVSDPANGTVSVNSNGTFTYTPDLNFTGVDTFTYRITDGTSQSNPGTVTITVQAVNDPSVANHDPGYSVDEDGLLTGSSVLANDTDPDTNPNLLTAVKESDPAHGTLTLNADGTFTYEPADNFFGTDSFTYRVSDGQNLSNVATVTIAVNSVNDAPVVADDGVPVPLTAIKHNPPEQNFPNQQFNVLANDRVGDPDPGETLTIIAVSDPAHGTATISADGKSVLYTPDIGYEGPDSFTYTVEDDGANPDNLTATATVFLNVVNFIPTDISGFVWTDPNDDGIMAAAERRLAGVEVRLVGSSFRDLTPGTSPDVDITVTTDSSGRYEFLDVEPGSYRIIETTPEYMRDGKDIYNTTATGFGTATPILTGSGNDFCDITIPLLSTDAGGTLTGNNFGEIGLDAFYINLNELLASKTSNGMYLGVGGEGEQLWHSLLDGWDNAAECSVTVSADRTTAVLTVRDLAGNVFSTTLTQFGATRFRIVTKEGVDGYLVRIEGTAADFGWTLQSQGGEAEGEYAAGVDSFMAGL